MMLLPGNADSTDIDRRQLVVCDCVGRERFETEPRRSQSWRQAVTRDADHVDRKAREQSVADVEALRYVVERESNECLDRCSAHFCMRERLVDELIANAIALTIRRDEQLGQEPKLTTDPTPREADNFSVVIGHP